MADSDKVFSGSIPHIYETYLVPLIFVPYAQDLAARAAARPPERILEIAAGTGVVTRALAAALPRTPIVATDLNQAMLDEAAARGTPPAVEWRHADAEALPFADASFDLVVCQFGVMFFPDKAKAFAEARRVLRPGGTYLFNVWDRIADNEFADTITDALKAFFPQDPPLFLPRAPYGYYDTSVIQRDLGHGGWAPAAFETVTARSRAGSAQAPALGFCQGSPLRAEIEVRDPAGPAAATDAAAAAIAQKFGMGPVEAKIQAHVATLSR